MLNPVGGQSLPDTTTQMWVFVRVCERSGARAATNDNFFSD